MLSQDRLADQRGCWEVRSNGECRVTETREQGLVDRSGRLSADSCGACDVVAVMMTSGDAGEGDIRY